MINFLNVNSFRTWQNMKINQETESIFNDILPSDIDKIVHRDLIDFDQEMHCAITSSPHNLFLCLSCGKAFCGGSQSSPIVQHFFDEMHPLALRLHDTQLLTIPDYQKIPPFPEVEDILFTANPQYTEKTLEKMHEKMRLSQTMIPGAYKLPSIVNAKARIAVIRFLSCIDPLRDFLLLNDFQTPIAAAFSDFFKHFFNPFYFKEHLSPDKLLHALPAIDVPFIFMSTILNALSKEFDEFVKCQQKESGNSSIKVTNILEQNVKSKLKLDIFNFETSEWKTEIKKAWIIPLQINDSPLYRKDKIIPPTTLEELLQRYNGDPFDQPDGKGGTLRQTNRFVSLPNYLIFNTNRIKKNEFRLEKNNIHIILPTQPMNFSNYGINAKYSLRALISHSGSAESDEYITYIKNKDSNTWLKCELTNITEVMIDTAVTQYQCCFILFEKSD